MTADVIRRSNQTFASTIYALLYLVFCVDILSNGMSGRAIEVVSFRDCVIRGHIRATKEQR